MNIGFNLKSPEALVTSKRVSLSFEVLKPGIDLLSSYENPGWHLFFYFENLLFSVVTFISYLLPFSCSVVSNSLQLHGLQHTRLPCLLPSPGACSNSWPLSWWCYPTVSSSVVSFSSCLQSPCSPTDSQESSPTLQFKSINSLAQLSLWSRAHIHTWLLEKP